MKLEKYGFLRVAAAAFDVSPCDPASNADAIAGIITKSRAAGVHVIAFPELSLTGATCGDMFGNSTLISGALSALAKILEDTQGCDTIAIIGMPLEYNGLLYNCAVAVQSGHIIAAVPKTAVGASEKWFASADGLKSGSFPLFGAYHLFGTDIVIDTGSLRAAIALEIGDDMKMPVSPAARLAEQGVNLIVNIAAWGETVSAPARRRAFVEARSEALMAGYVLCCAGQGEAVTDCVFSGHSIIAEIGCAEAETIYPKSDSFIFHDIDIERIINRRRTNAAFKRTEAQAYICNCEFADTRDIKETFTVKKDPFTPKGAEKDNGCFREIIKIQSTALAARLSKTGLKRLVLGVSGGLDSTLALIVSVEAVKLLGLPPQNVLGITMPGFGTTDRTYQNALTLMRELSADVREIPIRDACLQHFSDIGIASDIQNTTFENAQARERAQILFDLSNKEGAIVVGTGDLSEIALGWCTFGGDHLAGYSVNCGLPKTLMRRIVAYYAAAEAGEGARRALMDILDTPVSPELLPLRDGELTQRTEDVLGPYELHDFFIYHTVKNGFSPDKVLKLASIAFDGVYDNGLIIRSLELFYRRFFSQQFKRSCSPDGVMTSEVSLSPRAGWSMPGDAAAAFYLSELAAASHELENGIL